MIEDLLIDTCTIQKRTVDSTGKTSKETWSTGTSSKCRVMRRASNRNLEKTQHATSLSTVFALPKGTDIAIRDRISHESRIYEVIEVVKPMDSAEIHHIVAITEAIAGGV